MLARAAFPAFFLTFAGFLLLLLVTLSVPIIKTIYLLHVHPAGSNAQGQLAVNAGVFGLCYQGSSASILGIDYSHNAACTDAAVGYRFDDNFLDLNGTLVRSLTGSLVLNAIACGLAGLSMLMAFLAWFCASRVWEILTFSSLLLSALAAWIAWALDLALALVTAHRIRDATDDVYDGDVGSAVWLALVGAVVLSLAICLAGCGMFGRYRSDRSRTVSSTAGKRKYFWQKRPGPMGTY
ncbi:hypothetical protein IAU60_000733 [Kwoniella sp. DSM 27419]